MIYQTIRTVFTAATICCMLLASVTAAEITYSGTARLTAQVGDPWGLNPSDSSVSYHVMEFSVQIAGSEQNVNSQELLVVPANHFISGTMSIDGTEYLIDALVVMGFNDDRSIGSTIYDNVVIYFDATINGNQATIAVGYGIQGDSFDLLPNSLAAPPNIGEAILVVSKGTGSGPYSTFTSDGFTSVPGVGFIETTFSSELANAAPIANAGADVTVGCTSENGVAVTLDGTASSDPDGDELTFEWSVPTGAALDDPTSPMPAGTFPIGITTATLTVTDGNGGLDVDDVVITVVDQTPPEVATTTDIGAIWPPNHDMVPVTVCVYATDDCSAPESLLLGSVTIQSSEPDDADGLGDGETTGDVDGQDAFTAPVDVTNLLTYDAATACFVGIVWLRAERDGNGPGRSYSINASVLDSANNIAESSCVVVVPHDRRKQK